MLLRSIYLDYKMNHQWSWSFLNNQKSPVSMTFTRCESGSRQSSNRISNPAIPQASKITEYTKIHNHLQWMHIMLRVGCGAHAVIRICLPSCPPTATRCASKAMHALRNTHPWHNYEQMSTERHCSFNAET